MYHHLDVLQEQLQSLLVADEGLRVPLAEVQLHGPLEEGDRGAVRVRHFARNSLEIS